MKGQTSILAIAIAVIMVMFMMIFIFTTTITRQLSGDLDAEYRNLYVTNLLLSVLNTETNCGSFADMIKTSYFGGRICTDEVIREKLDFHISEVLSATGNTNYEWLLETEPDGGTSIFQWGNPGVRDEPGYWDARTVLSSRGSRIVVKLYIRNE